MASAAALQTKRLRLRPLAAEDTDTLHAIFLEPGVRRFLLDDTEMPRDWVQGVVQQSLDDFRGRRLGLWLVEERGAPGLAVGVCGFRDFFEPPQFQVIYALRERVWGRGYASEALHAMLEVAFDDAGRDVVIGATDPPNVGSIRVMERCGMSPVEPALFDPPLEDADDGVFFRIDRARWRAEGARVLER